MSTVESTKFTDPLVWDEYQQFLKAHELQLYSMAFPVEKLGEKLYYKLKYEVFESNVFKLSDNEEETKIFVQSNSNLIANQEVFLIDHCWTFKIRQFQEFVDSNPSIIERVFGMLKYTENQQPLMTSNITSTPGKYLKGKIADLKSFDAHYKKGELTSFYDIHQIQLLNYDNLGVTDTQLSELFVSPISYGISLEGSKLSNVNNLVKFLLLHPVIKAIWIDEHQFNSIITNSEGQEEEISVNIYQVLGQIKSIELINRRLTKNSAHFTVDFLQNKLNPYNKLSQSTYLFEETKTSASYYLHKVNKHRTLPNMLDLSSTQILTLDPAQLHILFKKFEQTYLSNISVLDLSYCSVTPEQRNLCEENLSALLTYLPKLERINTNLNIEELYSLNSEEDERLDLPELMVLILEYFAVLKLNGQNLKYLNEYEISKILQSCGETQHNNIFGDNNYRKKIEYFFKASFVKKYIWKIVGSYRFITDNMYDENITWYVNDEIGSALNLTHSDNYNVKMFPFIFSKSNDFTKESITYSILWPCKNIQKDGILYKDNLLNITELQQRSSKLSLWFDTPKEYFLQRFFDKLAKMRADEQNFSKIKDSFQSKFNDLETELRKDFSTFRSVNIDTSSYDYKKYQVMIESTYDFERLIKFLESSKLSEENRVKLYDKVIKNIVKSILDFDFEGNSEISSNLKNKLDSNPNESIKAISDLEYVKNNLFSPIEISSEIQDADIVWLNDDYYTLNPLLSSNKQSNLKEFHFKNQYPYEVIVTMKYHLMKLIQDTKGYCDYYSISYDLETELPELIGNYIYNSDPFYSDIDSPIQKNRLVYTNNLYLDNTWILKPINMARAMDMTVTNNLLEIIKNSETGPKICQKYIHNPFLMNGKKFDFRYMVLVKSMAPVELYVYTKVFWFRTSNNDFTVDFHSFTDYETHFTVMNYEKKDKMQQIFDYQFIEYLENKGISYNSVFDSVCKVIKEIFVNASIKCPQIIDPFARAIYALDVMIDENLQPKVLEFNFSPDCTRACKYTPSFYQDVFSTLFLNAPLNCQKL